MSVVRVENVTKEYRVGDERVLSLIAEQTEGRTFGVLGAPRVNVLLLNLELDRRFPLRSPPP